MIARRSFLTGLSSLIAAPAIVRADSLMKVRAPKIIVPRWTFAQGEIAPYGISPVPQALIQLRTFREQWEREMADHICFGRVLPDRTVLV